MKNKGFTLIELLAVLVILAILALITIPIVLSIINNARENSYARSVEAYGRAVETAVMEYEMNSDDNTSLPTDIGSYNVKTSRNEVTCSSMEFDPEDDSVILKGCHVGTKSGTYNYHNGRAYIPDESEEAGTSTAYSVGDEITVAGDTYYVIKDSDSTEEYVTALKANPLTVSEITAPQGVIVTDTKGDGSIGGVPYNEISNEYATSYVRTIIDSWVSNTFTDQLQPVGGYSARLITYDELLNNLGYDPDINSAGNPTRTDDVPSWVYNSNYNYWTMSPVPSSSSSLFIIDHGGSLQQYHVSTSYNVIRPVINVKKTKISL